MIILTWYDDPVVRKVSDSVLKGQNRGRPSLQLIRQALGNLSKLKIFEE